MRRNSEFNAISETIEEIETAERELRANQCYDAAEVFSDLKFGQVELLVRLMRQTDSN